MAFKTVARLARKHVPLFNQEMFTVKFSGESLCVLLMEYVPLTGIQFVRALLREHASVDNRMMLSNFMAQLVELIAEFHDKHGFLLKDVSLCASACGRFKRARSFC